MRRSVVHQAKWLLLGLLKTTASALATTAGGVSKSSQLMMYAATSRSSISSSTVLHPNQPLQSFQAVDQQLQRSSPQVYQQSSHRGATKPGLPPQQQEQILLRIARPADVRGISSCNLQTLPENYNDQFYLNHLSEWPDLAFVAVVEPVTTTAPSLQKNKSGGNSYTVTTGPPGLQQQQPLHGNYEPIGGPSRSQSQSSPTNGLVRSFQARFSFLPYGNHKPNSAASSPSSKVVAYLLGKTCVQQQQYMHHSIVTTPGSSAVASATLSPFDEHGRYTENRLQLLHHEHPPPPLIVGHVSSLAVLPEYRRRGLADALLEQFHAHLQSPSPSIHGPAAAQHPLVRSTGLHVRRSNGAAVRLYKKWGYTPAVCIPAYYEDGEDAYYMQKHFMRSAAAPLSRGAGTATTRLTLPRVVGGSGMEEEENVPQLLSGSI